MITDTDCTTEVYTSEVLVYDNVTAVYTLKARECNTVEVVGARINLLLTYYIYNLKLMTLLNH